MAERAGVSKDTVRRIWNELGIQPHRVDTFEVSNDPRFAEKLIDDEPTSSTNSPDRPSSTAQRDRGPGGGRRRASGAVDLVAGAGGVVADLLGDELLALDGPSVLLAATNPERDSWVRIAIGLSS